MTTMTSRAPRMHARSRSEAARTRKSRQLSTWLLIGSWCCWSASAFAAEDQTAPLAGEVLVLLASEKEGTIDPSLSHVRALKHAPFNGFKSMRIMSRSAVKLLPDQAVEIDLPNGRKIQLTLVTRLEDGRAKLEVSINRPYEKDYLPLLHVIASAGEPFFVAGQKFEGGTLVIGVRVGERPKHAP
jgi:hypothetical protein